MRILASLLGRPLNLYSGSEHGPAFGAARLARLAATGEEPAELCRRPKVALKIEPESALVEAYAGRLARFRDLYRALVPLFPERP
jgi:xylulokinase